MRELDDIVREGMPKSALDTFIAVLGAAHYGEYAMKLRNQIVPRSTYKRVDRFNLLRAPRIVPDCSSDCPNDAYPIHQTEGIRG